MNAETEHSAWLWLMALPRVVIPEGTPGRKYREMSDRQIKIEASPGKLHTNCGAPLVRLSLLLPNGKRRVKGSGNSLYEACENLQHEGWRAGVELPFISIFHMERTRHVMTYDRKLV